MVFDAGLKQHRLFVVICTTADKEQYEHSNSHHFSSASQIGPTKSIRESPL
jgi:hypothetical protein